MTDGQSRADGSSKPYARAIDPGLLLWGRADLVRLPDDPRVETAPVHHVNALGRGSSGAATVSGPASPSAGRRPAPSAGPLAHAHAYNQAYAYAYANAAIPAVGSGGGPVPHRPQMWRERATVFGGRDGDPALGWRCFDLDPPPGPDESPGEIATLHEYQRRLQDDRARRHEIPAQAAGGVPVELPRPLGIDDLVGFAVTRRLVLTVLDLTSDAGHRFKAAFGRARPDVVDRTLRPALGNPPHHAYPSNHSFQFHSVAEVMTRAGPELGAAPELCFAAARVAENREYAGLHYPSDTEAGRVLAQWFLPHLCEACRELMLAARREWIGRASPSPASTGRAPAPTTSGTCTTRASSGCPTSRARGRATGSRAPSGTPSTTARCRAPSWPSSTTGAAPITRTCPTARRSCPRPASPRTISGRPNPARGDAGAERPAGRPVGHFGEAAAREPEFWPRTEALAGRGERHAPMERLRQIVDGLRRRRGVARGLDSHAEDFPVHGTLSAGVIAARPPEDRPDALPCFGVDPGARVLALNTSTRPNFAGLINALLYAYGVSADVACIPRAVWRPEPWEGEPDPHRPHDLRATRLDTDPQLQVDAALFEVLLHVIGEAVPVVLAAGNNGVARAQVYPARLARDGDGLISVGALSGAAAADGSALVSGNSNTAGVTIHAPSDDAEIWDRTDRRLDPDRRTAHDHGVAPGEPFSGWSVLSTDIPGAFGDAPGGALPHRREEPASRRSLLAPFGGTSAACAIAAGVASLLQTGRRRAGLGRMTGLEMKRPMPRHSPTVARLAGGDPVVRLDAGVPRGARGDGLTQGDPRLPPARPRMLPTTHPNRSVRQWRRVARMGLPPRERLIEAATRLFAAHGYRAVGVARLIEEAGVSRDAMYGHFRSKDELVLSVLRRCDELTRDEIMRDVERRARDPRGRLMALFDYLGEWFEGHEFTGCMFLNASVEYHDRDDPIHRAAAEHKRLMLGHVEVLCRETGAADPSALARQVYMLFDGAVVQAHAEGTSERRLDAARSAVAALIDAARPGRRAKATG